MLERGQRDGRDRRRSLPRGVLGHHPEQPPSREDRGPGHPRPLRLAQAHLFGWQWSRGHGDLDAQQPGRQFRHHGNDPDRVYCLPGRPRRGGLSEPRIADRVTALHRISRRRVTVHRARPNGGRSSVSSSIRLARDPDPDRPDPRRNADSTLAGYDFLSRVSHLDCLRPCHHVRCRQHRASAHNEARSVSVPRLDRFPPPRLPQPTGRPTAPLPADYPLSSSVASATFTGFPSRSTGAPNTTVTSCSEPRCRRHRHRAPAPRTGP